MNALFAKGDGKGLIRRIPAPKGDVAKLIAVGLPPLLGRELRVARRQPRGQYDGLRAPKPTRRHTAHVFVGDVPRQASQSDLELLVSHLAPIVRVNVPRRGDGTAQGVAFVTLEDPEDTARVIRALDGVSFQGRRLRACPMRPMGGA